MVAIIGNKGNGKSALTDIIGILGNSHNQVYILDSRKEEELFSFLNREKFLKANCAASFAGELHWYAGKPDKSLLDARTDTNVPERVEYLPQKYLEKICANIEDDEFRHKLNEVIFEYVKKSDRYGQSSLDDLIAYLTEQAEADINVAKEALHEANAKVLSLEKRLTPDYKKDIEDKLRLKKADIAAHQETKPEVVESPKKGGTEAAQLAREIASLDGSISTIQRQIKDLGVEQTSLSRTAEDLRQARQTIERQINTVLALRQKYDPLLKKEGLTFDDLVSIVPSFGKLDGIITAKQERLSEFGDLLRSETEIDALGLAEAQALAAKGKSLVCQESGAQLKRKELTSNLDKPNRDYQNYLVVLAQWQARLAALEGESNNPASDTLHWLEQEYDAITKSLPNELVKAQAERSEASKAVFAEKKNLVRFYEEVKKSRSQLTRKSASMAQTFMHTIFRLKRTSVLALSFMMSFSAS